MNCTMVYAGEKTIGRVALPLIVLGKDALLAKAARILRLEPLINALGVETVTAG